MTSTFGAMVTAAATAVGKLGATVPVTVTLDARPSNVRSSFITPVTLTATHEHTNPDQGLTLVAQAGLAWRVGVTSREDPQTKRVDYQLCETSIEGIGVCTMAMPSTALATPPSTAKRATSTIEHVALLRQLVDWADALPVEAITNVFIIDNGVTFTGLIGTRRRQSQRVCEAVAAITGDGLTGSYGEGILPTGHRLSISE